MDFQFGSKKVFCYMLLCIAPHKHTTASEKKDIKKTLLIALTGCKNNTYIFPQGRFLGSYNFPISKQMLHSNNIMHHYRNFIYDVSLFSSTNLILH